MILAAILSIVLGAVPQPLALSLYPMCSTGQRSLWEVEAVARGQVDVSADPSFSRSRRVIVHPGDTFFWTRSSTVYIRDRWDRSHVLTASADGTACRP
jgi:hypothetical protein